MNILSNNLNIQTDRKVVSNFIYLLIIQNISWIKFYIVFQIQTYDTAESE